MQLGRIYAGDSEDLVLRDVMRTGNAWERMRGLLGRPALQAGAGMLIEPCNSVHTMGMSYPIDVLFLDRDLKVLKIVEHLRPWRMAGCRRAAKTLELAAGSMLELPIQVHTRLRWQSI